ncbi:MAG TPA: MoaD/ThiS family protein [Planctomycetota bacterium]|jgi:molybdopterin converting factor subunit 1|nr:MoaD/ThiS family protein [Planctomycetota bacterium]
MKLTVRLFGPLAERAGLSQLEVSVDGSTVADVAAAVARKLPGLRLDRAVRYAVNTDYAELDAPVREGDVVSLIPPVGGG